MKKIFTIFAFIAFTNLTFSSELFVKVNADAAFYAVLGIQNVNSNTNVFRFFDLSQGYHNLTIYKNSSNAQFYSGSLKLDFNQRLICEIDNFGNLTIVAKESINYINWYTCITSSNSNLNGSNNNWNNSSDAGYQAFVKMIEEESFDSNKLTKAKNYISKTSLSAAQIAEIMGKLSFDSGKLDWSKYAYQFCYDKQNYFMLESVFSFKSSYNDLEKFIKGQ
jgi:hypothetical protein